MSANKTVQNENSITDFLNSIDNNIRKKDAFAALEIMNELFDIKPMMWGNSIIGYDIYHYKYESGREGNFFKTGFSPRKTALAFYIMSTFPELQNLLSQLGKHKMSKSCLYINSLEQVDLQILKKILTLSYAKMNEKYPNNG